MTTTQPTGAEAFGRFVAQLVVGAGVAAFEGGWLLMLLLGAVAHQTGDPRWAVGYWTCVPVTLAMRFLYAGLTRSAYPKTQ